MFLAVLMVLPLETAAAATPRVTVRGSALPGHLVTLVGSGFSRGYLQARWDSAATRLRFISVGNTGRFKVAVRIPSGAAAGSHRITLSRVTAAAVRASKSSKRLVRGTVVKRVTVRVPVGSRPVSAGSVAVPASIDDTCGTNVSSKLNSWIASQPNGATLVFPSGSCYLLGGDAGLNLANRSGLTLDGTGSTLRVRTTGGTNFSSAFFVQNSTYITVRGFSVDGGNTATGSATARTVVNEHKNGASIRARSAFIEFDHVTWDHIFGFGILISDDGAPGSWPSDISIHDSTIRGGEMGIGITAGRRINIVHNAINDSVYMAVDLEPDQAQQGFQSVLISNNDVTRYSWGGDNMTGWFVAACPSDSVVSQVKEDGLTITGNRVHVGAAMANNGNFDGLGGLGIRADKANKKTNVVITNNTTTDNDTQSRRAVMYLANVQNLTVTGNRQPIVNGSSLVHDTGTTGTRTVSGNNVAP